MDAAAAAAPPCGWPRGGGSDSGGGEGAEEEEDPVTTETDEEFDLKQFGIHQALPVDGEPDWSSEVLDAEEYLRRVRHEAARCPRVVRANIDIDALQQQGDERRKQQQQQQQQQRRHDQGGQEEQQQHLPKPALAPGSAAGEGGDDTQSASHHRHHHHHHHHHHHPLSAASGPSLLGAATAEIAAAPAWAVPAADWVRRFVEDFQQLRRRVAEAYESGEYATTARLPGCNDLQAWDRICFGRRGLGHLQHGSDPQQQQQQQQEGEEEGEAPVPGSEVTFLSPAILPTLMALDQVGASALFLHHAQSLQDARPPALPLARAQWLFALAARLDKPLLPEHAAAFRAVFRHCAALRGGGALAGPGDPLLPRLNVIIAVAGAYFGQDPELGRLVDAVELF